MSRSMFFATSFVLSVVLLAFPAFAQVTTTTTSTVVTVGSLFDQAVGAYSAFRTLGVFVGLSTVINLLINVTKFGPIGDYFKKKDLKFIRPILAFAAGLLSSLGAAAAEGQTGWGLVIYALGGLLSGGGAVAIHEFITAIKGGR